MKKYLSKKIIGDIAYHISTKNGFNQTYKKLEKAISENGFSVITVHDLRDTFEKNNLEIPRDFEYKIVEICNSQKAHKVLNMSKDLGIMIPKSIII